MTTTTTSLSSKLDIDVIKRHRRHKIRHKMTTPKTRFPWSESYLRHNVINVIKYSKSFQSLLFMLLLFILYIRNTVLEFYDIYDVCDVFSAVTRGNTKSKVTVL